VPIAPADLFVSPDLTEADAQTFLRSLGFRDPVAADRHLREMADDPAVREALGRLAAPLVDALARAPDPDGALVGMSRYLIARTARVDFLDYLTEDPEALEVLVTILGTSPYLGEVLIRNPEYFHWLMPRIHRGVPAIIEEERTGEPAGTAVGLDALKRLKRREILRIATRDILGRETLQSATAQLSELAALIVDRALAAVSRDRVAAEGRDRLPGRFAVIGMGKLGGEELNYSSDIDLIYVYEPDDETEAAAHGFFQRLGRGLTAALTDHTAESYLYRVDLRLRPMGRSGNIAHSLRQLRQYYDMWGVTFERFALIKARPIAGDRGLGRRFVDAVQPLVYRPYLDYAALEEMYQHKAAVDRTIRTAERSRNVKLGRGGIREVELFTQVLQLTYGASHPELKQRNTLAALDTLRGSGLISDEACGELTRAYVFLRTVEHRLQIVQERQTHTLSDRDEDLTIAARRLGFASASALEQALEAHRERVHGIYRGLFERREGAGDFRARQYFRILSSELPDGDALAYLERNGFPDPGAALAAIQALGAHASAASAPATARNVLANLLSASAGRIMESPRPDVLLVRFEQLTVQTGGPTLLARSLLENAVLREALLDVLDSGDLLAQRLIRSPELLDSLAQPLASDDELRRWFDGRLARMERLDRPDRMNALRRFTHNEEFKILVGWLATRSRTPPALDSRVSSRSDIETSASRPETSPQRSPEDVLQEQLTMLADYCTARVAQWLAPASLEDPHASWAILALGKLGGMELTVHSDLDLVFVYEDERDPSDSSTRWQMFVEQVQNFLSGSTSEGTAFRVDTRLRPEGTKGALAIPTSALVRYFAERAEPWERLAWTRAQVLVGSTTLSARLSAAVASFVYGPWRPQIPASMHRIRMRMERELGKEGDSRLDLKVGRGGLVDIDFLLQLIQIREGHGRPEFRVAGTRRLLASLPANRFLTAAEANELREAHRFLRTVEIFVRLDTDSSVSWITPHSEAWRSVAIRMGFRERPGEQLLGVYRSTTERVRTIYTTALERLES
jgi:glutamate-ammonia-ligase adenylyltransferase